MHIPLDMTKDATVSNQPYSKLYSLVDVEYEGPKVNPCIPFVHPNPFPLVLRKTRLTLGLWMTKLYYVQRARNEKYLQYDKYIKKKITTKYN